MEDDFDQPDDDFNFFEQDEDVELIDAHDGENQTAFQRRAEDSEVDAPQKIENVSELFPNAPPNLFPVVVGCVGQAQLSVGIDLRKLSCGARNVEFVPSKTSTATMRLHEPSCVCLVRNSGSISVVGAVSAGAAKQAVELCARIIRKVLNDPRIDSFRFRVRSVLTRFSLGHPIRLNNLQDEFSKVCAYEPESFCGCIVKLAGTSAFPWAVTCNVFASGKVTMMGARSDREVAAAFYTLLPMLAKHTK
ncbi:TATA-binding protein, putative [Bodo saltans]|uniref:TATA-binding protein, putative n=1 Tax=Bodo saltans TaxID=75058 RepID=A0A0S4IM21_BODSA|nr:TATA-binding protein, putative [Bodo saltans]|eukprot:CUF36340.1 TATA-binding protein, putative [Bodo saltans]